MSDGSGSTANGGSYSQRMPQNGLGIAAMVLGIVGLVLCLGYTMIPSVLAIIFGVVGRRRVTQGIANNQGMATAGLVMGIIGTALGAIMWVVYGIALLGAMTSNSFS